MYLYYARVNNRPSSPKLRGATWLVQVSDFLWIPWTAQLTVVMCRIEGSSPVLTIIQLIGGILDRLGGDVLPGDMGGRGVPVGY